MLTTFSQGLRRPSRQNGKISPPIAVSLLDIGVGRSVRAGSCPVCVWTTPHGPYGDTTVYHIFGVTHRLIPGKTGHGVAFASLREASPWTPASSPGCRFPHPEVRGPSRSKPSPGYKRSGLDIGVETRSGRVKRIPGVVCGVLCLGTGKVRLSRGRPSWLEQVV